MKILGAILGALGGVSLLLWITEYIMVKADYFYEPLFTYFNADFCMYLAGLLFLAAIVCLLINKRSSVE
jgi:hypothetical protein